MDAAVRTYQLRSNKPTENLGKGNGGYMLSDDGEGLKATQSLAHTKDRTQRAERF